METITITKSNARTMQINHPLASYGIFCWTQLGDLFISSDWGFYTHSWRAFGSDFENFLKGLDSDYLLNKLEMNHINQNGKQIRPFRKENLKILIDSFIQELKKSL